MNSLSKKNVSIQQNSKKRERYSELFIDISFFLRKYIDTKVRIFYQMNAKNETESKVHFITLHHLVISSMNKKMMKWFDSLMNPKQIFSLEKFQPKPGLLIR